MKEGNAFLFWCLDIDCNEKYNPKATDMSKVTGLYAKFDSTNGSGSKAHSERGGGSGSKGQGDGSFSLLTAPLFVLVALLL